MRKQLIFYSIIGVLFSVSSLASAHVEENELSMHDIMSGGGWMSSGAGWWFCWVIVAVLVVLIIAVIGLLVTNNKVTTKSDPLGILKERLAKGEIDTKDFEERKKNLKC